MATIEPQSIRVTASNRQDFSHSANVEQFHNNEYVIPMRDQFGLIDYTGLTFSAKVDVPSSDFRPAFNCWMRAEIENHRRSHRIQLRSTV